MSSFTFSPTPLHRLIEKTDFLCYGSNSLNEASNDESNKEISKKSDMMSCFNPTDFYKLVINKEWESFDDCCIPNKLKRTYYFDPTELYKLIETKSWDEVGQRIAEYPEESAIWITRVKKDGSVRWKLLPLHALLLLKAPTDVMLQTLKFFPEAGKIQMFELIFIFM